MLALILFIIFILVAIGGIGYLIYDYIQHKKAMAAQLATTTTRIETEQKDRLSNLKFVVDQVNTVNDEIVSTMDSNVIKMNTNVNEVQKGVESIFANMGKFLAFSEYGSSNGSSNVATVSLKDLPGIAKPDVRLIQHVTGLMGITMKDLEANGNTVAFCSKQDPNRCIKFPDSDGNTLLTSMSATGKVKVDAPMQLNSSVTMFANAQDTIGVNISAAPDQVMLMKTKKMGIGSSFTNPEAVLHVKGADATTALFSLTGSAGPAITIDASGNLITRAPITLQTATGEVAGKLTAKAANNLSIETTKLDIPAEVTMNKLTVTQTFTPPAAPPATA